MTSEADNIVPGFGARPWPSVGDHDVILNEFNGRPSAGLVELNEGAGLFWQFFGHGTSTGLWLYVTLSDDEAEQVVEHPDELVLERLRSDLVGRRTYLLVSDRNRVIAKTPYTVSRTDSHAAFIGQMLRNVVDGLSAASENPPRPDADLVIGPDSAPQKAEEFLQDALACAQ
ncbi:MAG: hypothetical protein ACRDQ5_05185 [Sciscionella sp.]